MGTKYPVKVFKYYGNYRFAQYPIQNSELFMSSALDFNDPFDLGIPASTDIDDKRLEQFCIQHFYAQKSKYGFSDDDVINFIKDGKHTLPECKEGIKCGSINGIITHGVCCFSENENNFAMWAYYGNHHKGLCLCFKPNYSQLPFNAMAPVDYDNTYPLVDIDDRDNYKHLFLKKSKDWNHENEWRIILPTTAGKTVKFNFKELESVICGINMSWTEINNVRCWILLNIDILHNRPKLYKAIKKSNGFGIDLQEINLTGE